MKMHFLLLTLLLLACSAIVNYDQILETDEDYKEIISNYVSQFNKEPDFVLVENTQLTDEIIESKSIELKNNPYSALYSNLTNNGNLYLIKLQEKTEKNRGVIAVIDVANKKVIKIYGTLDLVLNGGE